jgi:NADPH:quinone reductase-like Zn-dependent oxidoreductase
MSTPSNNAAWLIHEKAKPFTVKEATYTPPSPTEIVIKNHAVAINPVDWVLQDFASFPLTYPIILGTDVAGEVVAVGSQVTSEFVVGDRVIGHALYLGTGQPQHGGFQLYTNVFANIAAKIPAEIKFESAAVLPLCLSTAAACLFMQGSGLGLLYPSLDLDPVPKKDQVVLVWGGASSVGCNAIQLAAAAGYDVIATASPRNFKLVKKLGASRVFNYQSSTIEDDLLQALEDKTLAGSVDTIVKDGSIQHLADVVHRCNGTKRIATTQPPPEDLPEDVSAKMSIAFTIKDDEAAGHIYNKYLPMALAAGKFVTAPQPEIMGHGLDAIQGALAKHKKGVSAKKLVVTL